MTDTTISLFMAIKDGNVFDPIKYFYGIAGNWMEFEVLQDGDDGIFPRVSDWTCFCNKLDKEGASAFLTWISSKASKRLVAETGYCKVERTGKHDDFARVTFAKPIRMIMGKINDKPIVQTVTGAYGNFKYQYDWLKNGRQDKAANMVTIWFNLQELVCDGEACDGADGMDRDAFMAFFRNGELLNTLSVDDRREVFAGILAGNSDFTAKFLNEVLSDYGVDSINVEETQYYLFGEDAVRLFEEGGCKAVMNMLQSESSGHFMWSLEKLSSIEEALTNFEGYSRFVKISTSCFNLLLKYT